MPSLFDGVTGLLADVFGDPVIFAPKVGAPRPIQSIFRETPVDLVDADGHPVRSVGPTWQVQRDLVPEVAKNDRIILGDGRIYEIQARWPSGSPATDAFLICDLFLVTT